MLDVVARAFPPRFGDASWRFGSAGVGLGQLTTMLLGMFVLMAVAAIGEQKRALRVLAGLAFAGALVAAVVIPLFSMDYVQLRALVDPRLHEEMDRNTWKSAMTGLLAVVCGIWMGVVGWRAGRTHRQQRGAATAALVEHQEKKQGA